VFEAGENPLSRLRERVRVRGGRLSEHALARLGAGENTLNSALSRERERGSAS
jgi:hypothetical protein